ncbi:cation transporter [Noviherbaspirillum cavernae]|uniref:Cation transporter n=1 Tax=Noviherbaspirillum cavernae TaxID=2320862 RepID=A0A418X1H4_9BURK|nr:cation diffusion facilitator family transporter [Noviherbaspirillum cavernae]RJG06303.1 cation transporter [Noviherbaspirillum cavernae]
MSAQCCASNSSANAARDPRYRRALWIALIVNAAMFLIEIFGGMRSGSTSLLADAVDFFGDAANYAVALAVLSMAVVWRSRAALAKGLCMGAFGLFVIGKTAWSMAAGVVPEATTMGTIGFFALLANVGVAILLYTYRAGDANMRSVWLCTRNDAIGNVAVMLAALGVFGTGSAWPDWLVASLMGVLALSASISVVRDARRELAGAVPVGHVHDHAGHSH